ncbi:hypothetical protein [Caulobacter sp. 17J65-9]|uniref:hypothetical protein n=1 Tax=Caulobacter sp. 17J65-9 TaxID=2709382 RepID=UPI0013CB237B|nr:hypothetical protein [Caulobacter sp. 17J65-9]NEX91594.1 hypothetical protein [Caulobacter sp. 17J65-9]
MARVVRRVFGALRRNCVTFAVLTAALGFAPRALFGVGFRYAYSVSPGAAVPYVFVAAGAILVSACLLQATIVYGAVRDLQGQRASLARCLTEGFARLLPLLGLSLILALALILGGLLMVVPGLVLAVLWVAAAPALVIERRGVFASFQRSVRLTRGNRWPVFGLLAAFSLMGLVCWFGLIVGAVATGATWGYVRVAIAAFSMAGVTLVSSVVVATIYYELRTAWEGEGAETLAAAFD